MTEHEKKLYDSENAIWLDDVKRFGYILAFAILGLTAIVLVMAAAAWSCCK